MFITIIIFNFIYSVICIAEIYPESCLLRCKDNYMNEMQPILSSAETSEWSLNLVTPLQSFFHKSTPDSIIPRIEITCRAHDEFLDCLNDCKKTKAQETLINGQESWSVICHSFRTDDDFTDYILPCWAEYGDEISKKCHIHALMVQYNVMDLIQNGINDMHNNLADLCRTITIYDKCYIWQTDQYCGEKSWRFLLSLNQKSSIALIKLLSENSIIDDIPESCQQWLSPSRYAQWHAERIHLYKNSANLYFSLFLLFILYGIV